MKRKKKTIIEEIPDDNEQIELNENSTEEKEILDDERELTPAEELSLFIDTLKEQQNKDYYIKIFKKYKNKKQWIDTIYEPETIPDEAEIRDRYGGGSYEIMLIYKDEGKTRVKSITYNIFEYQNDEDEDIDDYIDEKPSDINQLLALMIERDKEFTRQQMELQRQQFNMILQMLTQQQNQLIQVLTTIFATQRNTDYSGLADLIETIANVSGIAPEKNPLIDIATQLIPTLISLSKSNEKTDKEMIKQIKAITKEEEKNETNN